jgi:hypothetical protein
MRRIAERPAEPDDFARPVLNNASAALAAPEAIVLQFR